MPMESAHEKFDQVAFAVDFGKAWQTFERAVKNANLSVDEYVALQQNPGAIVINALLDAPDEADNILDTVGRTIGDTAEDNAENEASYLEDPSAFALFLEVVAAMLARHAPPSKTGSRGAVVSTAAIKKQFSTTLQRLDPDTMEYDETVIGLAETAATLMQENPAQAEEILDTIGDSMGAGAHQEYIEEPAYALFLMRIIKEFVLNPEHAPTKHITSSKPIPPLTSGGGGYLSRRDEQPSL